jgi:hypothetical protein
MVTSRKSRYAAVSSAVHQTPDGTQIPYLLRRIIPQSSDVGELMTTDPLRAAMRLDVLAGALLGDPEQFWRLLDANDGMNPFDFVEETLGDALRIPQPAALQS